MRRFCYRIVFSVYHRRIITNYLRCYKIRKLQIGSGANVLEGWLNTDLNPRKKTVSLDATKRFNFDDNTFDYVFMEHLIEHLTFEQGLVLLKECYRVLKFRGRIRISTPNLHFVISLYEKDRSSAQEKYIQWVMETVLPRIRVFSSVFVINNFFSCWGHKFLYDDETLTLLLAHCGFVKVKRYAVKESDDGNLRNIEVHGWSVGEEFNVLESMVLEAEKG